MTESGQAGGTIDTFGDMLRSQTEAAMQLLGQMLPAVPAKLPDPEQTTHWLDLTQKLQAMWVDFQADQARKAADMSGRLADPAQWLAPMESWFRALPLPNPDAGQRLWNDGMALWQAMVDQYALPAATGAVAKTQAPDPAALPFSDRRFADPRWRDQPAFALIHQTYLLFARQITAMAQDVEGLEPAKKEQLVFATRALVDALSPSNFPLTNPLVLERAVETNGDSLVRGMEHLIADLKRGQLTHTSSTAFRVGENIAVTPGKVVHETPLYQLIQYAPTTDKVLAAPLVIFPPWINRFYILDLNPAKSFVRWAVEQGITVFMVSWKSADATMADVVWDDYIAAQIDAIDTVRARLDVPAVHTIGYCVAGTTLAATLAVLARRDQAEKVRSATFFTAQVDFDEAGDLRNFVDDQQIEAIDRLATDGYLDGRYMAATFNLLRPNDLIWSYVVRNYLLGEDYPAFDLLHWNGDVTNLPAKWHHQYLCDLYRDNRLVIPDALSAGGTPIDLTRITTPCYVQAGREDHIAPPESVWKITRFLRGPWTFVLAGSGHIAGVVNPPSAGKYQYWTNPHASESLDEFIAGASGHAGSWWPHWAEWLRGLAPAEVPARGKRKPGSRGDRVIEDAPGRYVQMR